MKGSCSIKGVLPKGLNFDMVVVGYGDSGTFEDILNSVDWIWIKPLDHGCFGS